MPERTFAGLGGAAAVSVMDRTDRQLMSARAGRLLPITMVYITPRTETCPEIATRAKGARISDRLCLTCQNVPPNIIELPWDRYNGQTQSSIVRTPPRLSLGESPTQSLNFCGLLPTWASECIQITWLGVLVKFLEEKTRHLLCSAARRLSQLSPLHPPFSPSHTAWGVQCVIIW